MSRIAAGLAGAGIATLITLLEPAAAVAPLGRLDPAGAVAPARLAQSAVTVTVTVTQTELDPSKLAPEAFGDWDHAGG